MSSLWSNSIKIIIPTNKMCAANSRSEDVIIFNGLTPKVSKMSVFTEALNKFGIVAKNEVLSVLLIPGKHKQDSESNTSNILAKVLNLQGEIIIGDKALKIKDKTAIDLALRWREKTGLSFVFARYCFNKNEKIFNYLAKEFLKKQTKIPSYILNKYAKKLSIPSKELKFYLTKIDYFLGHKEEKSLKLFLKWSKIARN